MRTPFDAIASAAYLFGLPLAALTLSAAACGHASAPGQPVPVTGVSAAAAPDTAGLVARAVQATAPRRALRLVFSWSLQERDGRFSGQGVARVDERYRARLDLFGPRGEGYVSAAVVGEELRVPPSFQQQAGVVPAPALLWSALGVLRPPADARLTRIARSGDQATLEYARGDEHWRFTLVGDRVRGAELDRPRGGRQTVELRGEGPLGLPKTAVYRDYAAFRELTLTLDRANEAESFPPDTWSPGGR